MVHKIWIPKNTSESDLIDMWDFIWLKYSNNMSINVILQQLWVSYYDENIIRALLKINNLMMINDNLVTNQNGLIKNWTLLKVPKNLLKTPSSNKEKETVRKVIVKKEEEKKNVIENVKKRVLELLEKPKILYSIIMVCWILFCIISIGWFKIYYEIKTIEAKEKDSKYRDDKKEVLENTEKHQEANNLVSASEEVNRNQETTKKQLPKTFQIKTKEDIKILIDLIKEVENQK